MINENEHEITKMMLETIRASSSKHKNLIKENEEMGADAPVADVEADEEVDGADVETDQDTVNGIEGDENENSVEAKEEETKFMDSVSSRVSFVSFKIDADANNVTFTGKFDNGIDWQMTKKDGLYLNAPNIELDDEVLDLLKKLNGYYQNWSDEWSKKLNTEYKASGEE